MPASTERSIFSEKRHFGQHDAAIKALRARALELMSKVVRAQGVSNPTAEARYLAEAKMLQTAAAWLSSLEYPSVRRRTKSLKSASAA